MEAQSKESYSAYRRRVKTLSRLNYLRYINFDFGKIFFLTLTISDKYINDKKSIRNAKNRIQRFLRKNGIKYYIIAKEKGTKNNRLHFHIVAFRSTFNIPKKGSEIQRFNDKVFFPVWKIGFTNLQVPKYGSASECLQSVFYLTAYLKKGLNLQFSRAFFKDGILSNDVYYLVSYNKEKKEVFIDNKGLSSVFGAYVSKADYQIYKGHIFRNSRNLELISSAYDVFYEMPSEKTAPVWAGIEIDIYYEYKNRVDYLIWNWANRLLYHFLN